MQTKLGSFLESLASTFIGFGVALASQLVIFPQFGVHLSLGDNLMITVWFTLISIARSYCVRRIFNHRITRKNNAVGN